jgi:hypothetical protein
MSRLFLDFPLESAVGLVKLRMGFIKFVVLISGENSEKVFEGGVQRSEGFTLGKSIAREKMSKRIQ